VAAAAKTKATVTASAKPAAAKPARKAPPEGRSRQGANGAVAPEAAPEVATADVVEVVLAAAPVIGPDGKKILPDIDDSAFEKDLVADPTLKEDEKQGFVLSSTDERDEPEQQVMVAGATADPVKDYLKQIGKVPLLNAAMEVELAKRIEAGLFSEEKLASGSKIARSCSTSSSGSPRTDAGPRTTCSRPTCAWCEPREALHRARHAVPGPDPGREPRSDPRRREVRLHQGLQVLDVRDVVDPQAITRAMADQARTIRIPCTWSRSSTSSPASSGRCCRTSAASRRPRSWPKELDMTPEKVVEVQKYGASRSACTPRWARTATPSSVT
jgi:RNA polymerase primary sigma factor